MSLHNVPIEQANLEAFIALTKAPNGRVPQVVAPAPRPVAVPSTEELEAQLLARKEADERAKQEREAYAADKAARDAVKANLRADENFLMAQQVLLRAIYAIRVEGAAATSAYHELARYRTELKDLATKHGVRIVLVGNKTGATVVLV